VPLATPSVDAQTRWLESMPKPVGSSNSLRQVEKMLAGAVGAPNGATIVAAVVQPPPPAPWTAASALDGVTERIAA
jgi:hypothetical protein